jgi:hypothetical protein
MNDSSKLNIDNFAVAVSTTEVRITPGNTAAGDVVIAALSTNTVPVYVGKTGVTTVNGFPLLAGQTMSLDKDSLSNIFAISASASELRVLRSY